jgi:hypothetical protein
MSKHQEQEQKLGTLHGELQTDKSSYEVGFPFAKYILELSHMSTFFKGM